MSLHGEPTDLDQKELVVNQKAEDIYETYGEGDLFPAICVMCSSGILVFKVYIQNQISHG